MNLLCDIPYFNKDNIFFLDTKRNMVIEGKFTKLVYSDFCIALNGLYLCCPLQGQYINSPMDDSSPKLTYHFTLLDSCNIHLMKELTRIEHEIVEHYKEMFQIQKLNLYALRNQMKTGSIKVSNMMRETQGLKRMHSGKTLRMRKPESVDVSGTQTSLRCNDKIYVNKLAKAAPIHHLIAIKISGVWETDYNVGITFQFLRVHAY